MTGAICRMLLLGNGRAVPGAVRWRRVGGTAKTCTDCAAATSNPRWMGCPRALGGDEPLFLCRYFLKLHLEARYFGI